MEINWNGFLKIAVEEYPKEACAFLFSNKPYSPDEEWFVFPVKNVSTTPETKWEPDKKKLQIIKSKAKAKGLTQIGNVHTHPYDPNEDIEKLLLPSPIDLAYARRYKDIIRIILVADDKSIHGMRIHDKFDNQIPIVLKEIIS